MRKFKRPLLLGWQHYRSLARYVKFRVAHVSGMPGTFSPPPRVSDPYMHYGTCVTDLPLCMLGSLTSRFLWSRWRAKRSRLSRRIRNPRFYVSGKWPMVIDKLCLLKHKMRNKVGLLYCCAGSDSIYWYITSYLNGWSTQHMSIQRHLSHNTHSLPTVAIIKLYLCK